MQLSCILHPFGSMDLSSLNVSLILLAGGQGLRMNTPVPKQFLILNGTPVILHSLAIFTKLSCIREVIIVCDPTYHHLFPSLPIPLRFAAPGARRQDSVYNGLELCSPNADLICIHDGARPLISASDIENVLFEAHAHQAAVLAFPVSQTIKESDADGFVTRTLDRNFLWEIQTPQVATPSLLREGFAHAHKHQLTVTDDVSLVELLGKPVRIVKGSPRNLKITTPPDLKIAEALLYCARLGFENVDSARQSRMEACGPTDEDHSLVEKAEEKDPFCTVAASPNLQNKAARSIS